MPAGKYDRRRARRITRVLRRMTCDDWEQLADLLSAYRITTCNTWIPGTVTAQEAQKYAYAYTHTVPQPAKLTFVLHQWIVQMTIIAEATEVRVDTLPKVLQEA